jgi:hypothetical protein
MRETQPKPKDLATRVFEKLSFQLGWILILGSVFIFIGLPIQRALVVLWVRGSEAYFHQGIRVLRGKPVKFSDGQLVPSVPDFVTGLAMFMLVAVGLSYLLVFCLRFYERHRKNH